MRKYFVFKTNSENGLVEKDIVFAKSKREAMLFEGVHSCYGSVRMLHPTTVQLEQIIKFLSNKHPHLSEQYLYSICDEFAEKRFRKEDALT